MFYIRKCVKSIWYSFCLSKEEVGTVEDRTIKFGLKLLQRINRIAGENNIKLSEIDRAAIIVASALKFESFASDLVEANIAAESAKAKESVVDNSSTPQ